MESSVPAELRLDIGIKTKVTLTDSYKLNKQNTIKTQSSNVTETMGPPGDNGPGPLGESSLVLQGPR